MRLAVRMWEVRWGWDFCGLGASVKGAMGEVGWVRRPVGRRWRGRAKMFVSWTKESGGVVGGGGRMLWWKCE